MHILVNFKTNIFVAISADNILAESMIKVEHIVATLYVEKEIVITALEQQTLSLDPW